jgi:hypothetical protein
MAGHDDEIGVAFGGDIDDRLRWRPHPYHRIRGDAFLAEAPYQLA